MNSISFDNAWLLLIAIPIALVFLIPFFIAVRQENRNAHNVASVIMHVVMAIIIAFAAAGTTFVAVLTETQVYVVADVSYSANKNLNTIDSYIKNIKLPQNSKVGLVCFGKDYDLVSGPVNQGDVPSVTTADVDDSQTNIAAALEYTGGLFDSDVIKRVVLITDAKQTDQKDTYAIRRAVDALEAQNVRVDAIFLDDSIGSSEREVQISGVDYTHTAYLNKKEKLTVTVQSSYNTDGLLVLYKDGQEVARTAPGLTEGSNAVTMDLDTSVAGVFDYDVVLTADGDKSDKNNSYSFTQEVSDSISILAITENWETVTGLVDRYGDKCSLDIYENARELLSNKSRYISQFSSNDKINIYDYGVVPGNAYGVPFKDVPVSIEDLCQYDEIIIADADISSDKFKSAGEFVSNVDTVVSMFGKGLTTYGNLNIQRGDSDDLKELGGIIPVQFGKGDDPRLLALVIDSSSSMNQNFHFSMAKQVATKVAGLLGEGDRLCIITFFGEAQVVMTPTEVTSASLESINKAIDDLRVRQGTLIGSGLYNAYMTIDNLPYSQKQVMLITDGANFGNDPHDPVEVASNMLGSDPEIVTSVFDVGRKSGDEGGGSEQLLRNIALNGGGKYYASNNQETLGDDLFAQIVDDQTETVIEKDSAVRVNRSSDSVLENIDTNGIPQVSGFLKSRAKASATTVLQAEYKRTENSAAKALPLYSYWNYGNGVVSTFTSSFTGAWLQEWDDAGITSVFLDNVLNSNLPDEKANYPFLLNVERGGGFTSVQIIPATSRFNAEATVFVTSPDGQTVSEVCAFNQYYYYYDFASAETGDYDISVTYKYYDRVYTASAHVSVPYTDEYNEFAAYDVSVLYRALNGRGKVSVNGELTLENDANSTGTYIIDLTIPLLIVCVVLYVADIVVRKLKWDDVVSFFGAFKKGGGEKQ